MPIYRFDGPIDPEDETVQLDTEDIDGLRRIVLIDETIELSVEQWQELSVAFTLTLSTDLVANAKYSKRLVSTHQLEERISNLLDTAGYSELDSRIDGIQSEVNIAENEIIEVKQFQDRLPPSLTNNNVPGNGLAPAEDALSALTPGTYMSEPNSMFRLDGRATLDPGVNIIGQGSGKAGAGSDDEGTKFICTSADAELYYGPIGYWGVNGQYHIDGQNIAINPLHLDIVVNSSFNDIKVRRGVQDNILLEGVQNSSFQRIESTEAGEACMALDYGTANNRFEGMEFNRPGTYCLVARASGPIRPGSFTVAYNYNNQFYGGIFEYMFGVGLGAYYQSAAVGNKFGHGLVFAISDGPVGCSGIVIENDSVPNYNGEVILEGLWIQGAPVGIGAGGGESIGVHIKSTNASAALRVYGHNPFEHLKWGLRYPAGLYTACVVNGHISGDSVSGVQMLFSHGDALPGWPGGYPEYALLHGVTQQAHQAYLSTAFDVALGARVRGDAHPRVTLTPTGISVGSGLSTPAATLRLGYQATHWYTDGMLCAAAGIGVGGITAGAPASAPNQKMPAYNEAGGLIGYIAISPP